MGERSRARRGDGEDDLRRANIRLAWLLAAAVLALFLVTILTWGRAAPPA